MSKKIKVEACEIWVNGKKLETSEASKEKEFFVFGHVHGKIDPFYINHKLFDKLEKDLYSNNKKERDNEDD